MNRNHKLVFVYQRVATYNQAEQEIDPIKAQDALVDLAKEDGYTEDEIYVEKRDLCTSGLEGPEGREGLAYLVSCIERDMVETVYVADFSRLSRDQTLVNDFNELCKKHKVTTVACRNQEARRG